MKGWMKLLVLSAVSVLFFVACEGDGDGGGSVNMLLENSGKIVPLSDVFHDWGNIDIAGGDKEHVFSFANEGDSDLVLKGASTSCMCTTAQIISSDGSLSPLFGMHQNPNWGGISIAPGEAFEVKVVFDPMAHGPSATGPISRFVYLETSSVPNGNYAKETAKKGSVVTEIRAEGDVLSSEDYLNL